MIKRFLYDSELSEGETIRLDSENFGDDLKHLRKVLRAKAGDSIEVINGRGVVASAQIISIDNKRAEAAIRTRQVMPKAKTSVSIIQGALKGQRMDWCFEKLTEIGTDEIFVTVMERSQVGKKEYSNRIDRWSRIIRAAMKQSGCVYQAEVFQADSLRDAIKSVEGDRSLILAATIDPARPALIKALQDFSPAEYDKIVLVVGPESGFSKDEETLIAKYASTAVYLGNTTLRSETASLVMAGIVKNWIDSVNG